MMQVHYFSWMRERIGTATETIDPGDATTARELVIELCRRDARYGAAFADLSAVQVAVDQEMRPLDTPIAGASEIAFFPPVTGG